eukprot:g14532.t1
MYDRPSMMELQQARPKTMGSIAGGSSTHRSTVARKGVNWYPGRRDYPNLGPGVYHQASRMFLAKDEAVMLLPGSRRGFHCFLNSGRSKRLMGDAVLFKTARSDGEHLGPGSYDLPSTLTTGRRPGTAPEASIPDMPLVPHARVRSRSERVGCAGKLGKERAFPSSTSSTSPSGMTMRKGIGLGVAGLARQVVYDYKYLEEERAEDVRAVRALPNINVSVTG